MILMSEQASRSKRSTTPEASRFTSKSSVASETRDTRDFICNELARRRETVKSEHLIFYPSAKGRQPRLYRNVVYLV